MVEQIRLILERHRLQGVSSHETKAVIQPIIASIVSTPRRGEVLPKKPNGDLFSPLTLSKKKETEYFQVGRPTTPKAERRRKQKVTKKAAAAKAIEEGTARLDDSPSRTTATQQDLLLSNETSNVGEIVSHSSRSNSGCMAWLLGIKKVHSTKCMYPVNTCGLITNTMGCLLPS